jgi:hypothetical protein
MMSNESGLFYHQTLDLYSFLCFIKRDDINFLPEFSLLYQ